MKHYRQKIRETVASLLSGIDATIYRTRVYRATSLPAISVFISNERITYENNGPLGVPPRYSREADLVIEVSDESTSDVDDKVDRLASEVESLIGADVSLGGVVEQAILSRVTFRMSGEGDKAYMTCEVTYRVWYRTTASDPENAI